MSTAIFRRILDDADRIKRGELQPVGMAGKRLGMIFEQPSLRTRVSFEVAMLELGGHALYLHPAEVGLGRRESVADVARILGTYVDAVVLRAFAHQTVEEYASHSPVPTVNGLSNLCHPCQGLTDIFTIREIKGANTRICYVGDGNAVAHALMLGAAHAGMRITLASPTGHEPNPSVVASASAIATHTDAEIRIVTDPVEAVREADVVYTDAWRSIGQELEYEHRRRVFLPYRVNGRLVEHAKENAIVMHDLPANRGEEITDEMLDGPASVVQTQAANRVPVQKALLNWLIGGL